MPAHFKGSRTSYVNLPKDAIFPALRKRIYFAMRRAMLNSHRLFFLLLAVVLVLPEDILAQRDGRGGGRRTGYRLGGGQGRGLRGLGRGFRGDFGDTARGLGRHFGRSGLSNGRGFRRRHRPHYYKYYPSYGYGYYNTMPIYNALALPLYTAQQLCYDDYGYQVRCLYDDYEY
ncbi:hypothetical protein RvY_18175 [Ramazzottius varieornatus]|uniref:Uncharacterized protein n=1 Tax=Ramazzottius varieornatus TaxID=947166 RepID=A0A1D1W6J8_RAMVA|nr:hypothetical protein RvY_18175 [Ramazzottius varieornatus]